MIKTIIFDFDGVLIDTEKKGVIDNYNLLIIWKKNVNYEKANFFDVKEDLENILKKCEIIGKN